MTTFLAFASGIGFTIGVGAMALALVGRQASEEELALIATSPPPTADLDPPYPDDGFER
jgi:hypothetical protein